MKDYNAQLEIQAYLDGELTGWKARQVEQWLATEPEAQQLHAELLATRNAVRANEPEIKLPVPREFYWDQIQRGIAKTQADETETVVITRSWWLVLRRLLAPASAFAVMCLLALGISKLATGDSASHYVEIVNYSEDMHVSSFRAASEKMFVVWVSPKEYAAADESNGEEAYQ